MRYDRLPCPRGKPALGQNAGPFNSPSSLFFEKYLHTLHGDQKPYGDVLKKACKSGATMYLRTLNTVNSANFPLTERAQSQERQIREAFSGGWKIEKIEWKNIEVRLSPEETVKTDAWFAQIANTV